MIKQNDDLQNRLSQIEKAMCYNIIINKAGGSGYELFWRTL